MGLYHILMEGKTFIKMGEGADKVKVYAKVTRLPG